MNKGTEELQSVTFGNTDAGEAISTESTQASTQIEQVAVYAPYIIGAIIIIVVSALLYMMRKKS